MRINLILNIHFMNDQILHVELYHSDLENLRNRVQCEICRNTARSNCLAPVITNN